MSRKSRYVYSNKLFGAGQGKAVAARHLVEQCFGGLYSAPLRAAVGKRKSDDPCRWVIAFLVPCGTGRVNDKKVNEENSNFKNKGFVLSEEPLVEVHVSNIMPLLDTTYHFFGRITSPFFDFSPINVRKIAFLEKRTNSTRSSRQTDEQA